MGMLFFFLSLLSHAIMTGNALQTVSIQTNPKTVLWFIRAAVYIQSNYCNYEVAIVRQTAPWKNSSVQARRQMFEV